MIAMNVTMYTGSSQVCQHKHYSQVHVVKRAVLFTQLEQMFQHGSACTVTSLASVTLGVLAVCFSFTPWQPLANPDPKLNPNLLKATQLRILPYGRKVVYTHFERSRYIYSCTLITAGQYLTSTSLTTTKQL